jgi:hypothetical protein
LAFLCRLQFVGGPKRGRERREEKKEEENEPSKEVMKKCDLWNSCKVNKKLDASDKIVFMEII